jgi:hypothetical protein
LVAGLLADEFTIRGNSDTGSVDAVEDLPVSASDSLLVSKTDRIVGFLAWSFRGNNSLFSLR